MKKFLVALLFMLLCGCAAPSSTAKLDPAAPSFECFQKISLQGARPEDVKSLRHYANKACEVADGHEAVAGVEHIQVVMLSFNEVMYRCSKEDKLALACVLKVPGFDSHYTMLLPHGNAGAMMHELLHIILWEQGVPGDLHHHIMSQKGWYWVGPTT